MTLIELLVTLAVLAIVVTLAVPGFQDFVRRNRLAADANNLVTSLAMARSEAVKRATNVTVASANWENGWSVFVDGNNDGVMAAQADLIQLHQPGSGASDIKLDASTSGYVTYNASGVSVVGTTPTGRGFEVCKEGQSRMINIIPTGRVGTTSGTCS